MDSREVQVALCESQLCLHITWSTKIKWLNFASSKQTRFTILQPATLKYHNFWSKGNKTSLSCFDDKHYILKYWVDTLAYEHKDIVKKI